MELPAFIVTFKEKISSLKDKIVAWIQENRKLSIILACLISIMLICIVLLISISVKNKAPKEKVFEDKLVLSQELIVPNGPELPRDYTISRETKDNWSDQEAEKWFTVPTDKEINGLSKANDNIVNEILGVAP